MEILFDIHARGFFVEIREAEVNRPMLEDGFRGFGWRSEIVNKSL